VQRSFLKTDYDVDCDSDEHKQYELFAWAMIAVYPVGIPLLYLAMLWRRSAEINEKFDVATVGERIDKLKEDIKRTGGAIEGDGKEKHRRVSSIEVLKTKHRRASQLDSLHDLEDLLRKKEAIRSKAAGPRKKEKPKSGVRRITMALQKTLLRPRVRPNDPHSSSSIDSEKLLAINAAIKNYQEVVALHMRDNDQSVAHLDFLFGAYEPRCWYWEVVESVRRLALTGMLVFCMPDSASQLVIGMIISMAAIVVYSEIKPYRSEVRSSRRSRCRRRRRCPASSPRRPPGPNPTHPPPHRRTMSWRATPSGRCS